MKKVLSSVIAATLAASVFLAGCSDINADSENAESTAYTGSYGKYAQIGTDVYAAFEEKIGADENVSRAVMNATLDSEFEDLMLVEDLSTLKAAGYISKIGSDYIARIENAIDNGEYISDILSEVSEIEDESIEKLSDDDLDIVLTYAETVKAVISYVDDVMGDDGYTGSRAIRDKDKSKEKESKGSFRERCGRLWDRVKEPVKAAGRGAIKAGAKAANDGAGRNEILNESVKGAIGGACGGIAVEVAKELHKRSQERYKDRDWRRNDKDRGRDK